MRYGLKYLGFMAVCIMVGTAWSSLAGAQQEASKEPAVPDEYRIGAGDVLQILVWREPDASLPETMQKVLVDKIGVFIHNPVVTVHTKQINSRKVYVMGAVKKEGPVPLIRPMTVLQAIDEAGGFTEFAKKKKIYVLRKVNGKEVKLPFDYSAVVKGEKLEENVTLMLDDTIVVP
jgi:polysaccharide export outer membrane protein